MQQFTASVHGVRDRGEMIIELAIGDRVKELTLWQPHPSVIS